MGRCCRKTDSYYVKALRSLLLGLTFAATYNSCIADAQNQSHNNVNVQTNYGTVLQQNTIVMPKSTRDAIRHAHIHDSLLNVLLPGNLPAPQASSACPHGTEAGKLRIILAGYGDLFCSLQDCDMLRAANIDTSPNFNPLHQLDDVSTLLSVKRDGRSMRVHAEIYAADGKIAATIEDDNRVVQNEQETFDWQRPNAHTLIFKSTDNRPAIDIQFLNPTTLYVKGVFYDRHGNAVHLPSLTDPSVADFRGVSVSGVCSTNTGGIMF